MPHSYPTHRQQSFTALLVLIFSLFGLGFFNAALAEDTATLTVPNQEEKGFSSLLSSFGQKLGIGGNQDRFLPPEQVFILSIDVVNHSQLAASWEVADGYYLYEDKFSFEIKDNPDISAGLAILPQGKEKHDEAFGLMEVFYSEVTAQIPLIRQTKDATVTCPAFFGPCEI